ncbi:uncharacterized protein CLAFUR5_13776 [Fulvia fulva]|uniref:Rhodopsin domain-containing protein n=1 Tax=Passalora fulva TaxID=5499 RepID=A0A9Q8PL18_PASFU|nr:uncharacterized protein CLAFUR5_13776 [Fulvia fulva]UJO24450.1 hypothetical protein CLAFUR5_13776 [Fulvia fulva]WPV36707.1 hypothetical protein CLAFUW7_13942 [Fulvia fulva]
MVSGYASPEAVLGLCFTFTSIAFISCVLRMYSRLFLVRQPGWDDLCVSIAMTFTIVDAGAQVFKIRYGMGQHTDTLSDAGLSNLEKSHWVAAWNYFFGLGFAKLSIILQCLRIFAHVPKFRRWAWALLSIQTVSRGHGLVATYEMLTLALQLFTLWTGIQSIFLCYPVEYFWDKTIEGGKCLPRVELWFFISGFNILTDIATVILPIPMIKDLQMPKREKRALMAVLCLGGIVCVITIIRLYSLYVLVGATDPVHEIAAGAIYSNLEVSLAIFLSCLPTLKGLLTSYLPMMFMSRSDPSCGMSSSTDLELTGQGKSQHSVTVQASETGSRRDWSKGKFRFSGRGSSVFGGRKERVDIDSEVEEGSWGSKEGKGYWKGEIEVVTTVEQVERRLGSSSENLVPVAQPLERP